MRTATPVEDESDAIPDSADTDDVGKPADPATDDTDQGQDFDADLTVPVILNGPDTTVAVNDPDDTQPSPIEDAMATPAEITPTAPSDDDKGMHFDPENPALPKEEKNESTANEDAAPDDVEDESVPIKVANTSRACQVLADHGVRCGLDAEKGHVIVHPNDLPNATGILKAAALDPIMQTPGTTNDDQNPAKPAGESTETIVSPDEEAVEIVAEADGTQPAPEVTEPQVTGTISTITSNTLQDNDESDVDLPVISVDHNNLRRLVRNPNHRKVLLESLLNSKAADQEPTPD